MMTPYLKDYRQRLDFARSRLDACRADPSFCRNDDLDQCPATMTTTLDRLTLLMCLSGRERRRVLLLGDDDLLSVALVAAGIGSQLTVVDLDDSLLLLIEKWTKPAAVELLHHDLRVGLPQSLASQFDVVFTDPPYTPAGQLLFLGAGVFALRPVRSARLFLCASRLYLGQDQIQMIVDVASRAGLQLVQLQEDFNQYESPPDVVEDVRRRSPQREASHFNSSLFHFTPKGDVLRPAAVPFLSGEIYKYEEDNVTS